MYILLNDEPYADIKDYDLFASGSLGCNLIGINVDTRSNRPTIYPIYRPLITFIKRPGQFLLDIPLGKGNRTLIIAFAKRWPLVSWWTESIALRML